MMGSCMKKLPIGILAWIVIKPCVRPAYVEQWWSALIMFFDNHPFSRWRKSYYRWKSALETRFGRKSVITYSTNNLRWKCTAWARITKRNYSIYVKIYVDPFEFPRLNRWFPGISIRISTEAISMTATDRVGTAWCSYVEFSVNDALCPNIPVIFLNDPAHMCVIQIFSKRRRKPNAHVRTGWQLCFRNVRFLSVGFPHDFSLFQKQP